jgi:phage-related minor tail protein
MSQLSTPAAAADHQVPSPPQKPAANPEVTRDRYGALLIGGAFVLLGVVFGVAMAQFTSASDVAAVVGSVGTVVGTIIGAYFGVHAGSSGRQAAEAGRAKAEKVARVALAKLDPHSAQDLMGQL